MTSQITGGIYVDDSGTPGVVSKSKFLHKNNPMQTLQLPWINYRDPAWDKITFIPGS